MWREGERAANAGAARCALTPPCAVGRKRRGACWLFRAQRALAFAPQHKDEGEKLEGKVQARGSSERRRPDRRARPSPRSSNPIEASYSRCTT